MKAWMAAACALALAVTLVSEADAAKRVGGGKSVGMQRSAPAQQAPQTPPQQAVPQKPATAPTAAPATAGATAAAAAPAKRSWLGPIAGLAAGLGLAALMSHLGMGEAFANFLMLALLAVAAIFVIRFLMRRFGGTAQRSAPSLATAGGPQGAWREQQDTAAARAAEPAPAPAAAQPMAFTPASADVSVTGQPLRPLGGADATESTSAAAPAAAVGLQLPEGFDLPAFERVAKMIFIRLQAANDKRDLDDLRQFTTPELFAALKMDLLDRGDAAQHTEVERVQAEVVDFAREEGRHIVSVRFQGLIREDSSVSEAFDELWHLVKPEADGAAWAIAGIQQPQ